MATDKHYNGHAGKMTIKGSFTLTTGGAVLAQFPAQGRIFTAARTGVGTYSITFFLDKFAEINYADAKYNPTAVTGLLTQVTVSARTGGSQTAQASLTLIVGTLAAGVYAAADVTSGQVDFEVEVAYFSGNA